MTPAWLAANIRELSQVSECGMTPESDTRTVPRKVIVRQEEVIAGAGTPAAADDYLTSASVRKMYGDISDMTLWRWRKGLGFPPPDLIVNGRKFWRRHTVAAWKPSIRSEKATA